MRYTYACCVCCSDHVNMLTLAQISSTHGAVGYAAQQDNLIFGKCPVRIFYYSAAACMLIFHGDLFL